MSGDIGLDTLKRQQVRSNESVFAPPEAKAVRLHVPAGSTLKGTLTRRETSYIATIRQLKLIHLSVVLLIQPYDAQHTSRPISFTTLLCEGITAVRPYENRGYLYNNYFIAYHAT